MRYSESRFTCTHNIIKYTKCPRSCQPNNAHLPRECYLMFAIHAFYLINFGLFLIFFSWFTQLRRELNDSKEMPKLNVTLRFCKMRWWHKTILRHLLSLLWSPQKSYCNHLFVSKVRKTVFFIYSIFLLTCKANIGIKLQKDRNIVLKEKARSCFIYVKSKANKLSVRLTGQTLIEVVSISGQMYRGVSV